MMARRRPGGGWDASVTAKVVTMVVGGITLTGVVSAAMFVMNIGREVGTISQRVAQTEQAIIKLEATKVDSQLYVSQFEGLKAQLTRIETKLDAQDRHGDRR